MGWETRKGKRYYYRKERGVDGRVRSVYCGSGARGEQAAAEDEARRAQENAPNSLEPEGDSAQIESSKSLEQTIDQPGDQLSPEPAPPLSGGSSFLDWLRERGY